MPQAPSEAILVLRLSAAYVPLPASGPSSLLSVLLLAPAVLVAPTLATRRTLSPATAVPLVARRSPLATPFEAVAAVLEPDVRQVAVLGPTPVTDGLGPKACH